MLLHCGTADWIRVFFLITLSQWEKATCLNVNEVDEMEKLEIHQSLFHVLLPASCRLLHSLNFLSFRMKIADSKTSQGIQTWCKVFSVTNMQIQRCRLHVSALSTVERDQKHVWFMMQRRLVNYSLIYLWVRCNLQAHKLSQTERENMEKTALIFFWLKNQSADVQH